jgi:hypothetical protein
MSPSLYWTILVVVAQAVIFLVYLLVVRVRRIEPKKKRNLITGLELVMLPVLLVPHIDLMRGVIIVLVVLGALFLTEVVAWPSKG